MRAFWQDGYGVSTRQLAAAMGINQYSVYASFETKAGLFERALNRYIDDVVEGAVLLPLRSEGAAMPALREFLEGFVHTKKLDVPDGCLICNTMIDTTQHTPPVLRAIKRYRDVVKKAFSVAITNEFPQMPRSVVRARSDFLLSSILGLFVQKKMGAEGRPVQTLVDEIIAAVERDFGT